tara:strand:+ start:919 stop:1569 length:651 start_codon:yes stop_codon:yes gene_type:complete
MLSACGTIQGIQSTYAPVVRVPELVPKDLSKPDAKAFKMELVEGLGLDEDAYGDVKTLSGLLAEADPAIVTMNREIVIGSLLAKSDATCNEYLADITRGQRTWRSTFSILGLAFGTAGGVATPEGSSKLLSALSGGMSGLSGKLDEGLLSNQAGHLIRASNIALREELRLEIVRSMSPGGEYENAPLPLMLSVVQSYHSRCSIDDGLTRLNEGVAP